MFRRLREFADLVKSAEKLREISNVVAVLRESKKLYSYITYRKQSTN